MGETLNHTRSLSRGVSWPRGTTIMHSGRLCLCPEPFSDIKQIFEFEELSKAAERFVDFSHFLCCNYKP